MEHLAIMKKSWNLLAKVLTGEKKIESRWYKNKSVPWDKIKKGDRVYFKNSGEPVIAKAEVSDVLQYSCLSPKKVKKILEKYGQKDGLGINELGKYYKLFRNKKYCILIFLRNPKKINPFEISKKGFGNMAAWITIDDISKIKVGL